MVLGVSASGEEREVVGREGKRGRKERTKGDREGGGREGRREKRGGGR